MRPPSLTAVKCANPPLPRPCSLLPARHLSLYHGPAPGVGPLRALPALITLRRRFPRAHTASSRDRKSTRLNSSHSQISYAVFCLKKKKKLLQLLKDERTSLYMSPIPDLTREAA